MLRPPRLRASCTLGRGERTGGSCLQRPLPASARALSLPPPPRLLAPGVCPSSSLRLLPLRDSPGKLPQGQERLGWSELRAGTPEPEATPPSRSLRGPCPPAPPRHARGVSGGGRGRGGERPG